MFYNFGLTPVGRQYVTTIVEVRRARRSSSPGPLVKNHWQLNATETANKTVWDLTITLVGHVTTLVNTHTFLFAVSVAFSCQWFLTRGPDASFCVLSLGMEMAWMSPVLVKLREANQTPLSRPITEQEGAWLASIAPLGGMPMVLISSYLLDRVGRRWCFTIACVPRLAQSLLYLCATELWMLYLARLLSGLSATLSLAVATTYTTEIGSKEIRGALGSVAQVQSAAGALVILAVGPFVSYFTMNIIFCVITIALIIPQMMLPESPYYLYVKGQKDEALKVLKTLRKSERSAIAEMNDYFMDGPISITKDLLCDKVVLKTIGKTIFLGIMIQMSGFNAVTQYLQTIFESTRTNLMPEVASVIIGIIQLLACLCAIFLNDRFGRKPILSITLFGTALGMLGQGIFFKLTEDKQEITGFMNALPLISLILVIFFNNAGIGSIIWILTAELFDGPCRAVGVCVGLFFSIMFIFIITNFFTAMINAIGPAYTYWFFSINCIISALFILFCIPETKGRTFNEIQEVMGRKMSSVSNITIT